jgi:hypothetical protein
MQMPPDAYDWIDNLGQYIERIKKTRDGRTAQKYFDDLFVFYKQRSMILTAAITPRLEKLFGEATGFDDDKGDEYLSASPPHEPGDDRYEDECKGEDSPLKGADSPRSMTAESSGNSSPILTEGQSDDDPNSTAQRDYVPPKQLFKLKTKDGKKVKISLPISIYVPPRAPAPPQKVPGSAVVAEEAPSDSDDRPLVKRENLLRTKTTGSDPETERLHRHKRRAGAREVQPRKKPFCPDGPLTGKY